MRRRDKAYNAGLFVALVDRLVSAPTLRAVVDEMYWPKSPFVFSVIEPEFLAAVYEQFLGERISLRVDRTISLEVKPELLHNQGAVPTPPWLIGRLVEFAFAAVVDGSAAAESVTILDPACGSGGFLLSVYEKLLAELEANGKRASLEDRSQLAARALFGVDIDPEAAEVCRLSLLLAILDDEEVDHQTANSALPDLRQNVVSGNSLIDTNFDTVMPAVAADVERRAAVAPFDWAAAFPSVVSDAASRSSSRTPRTQGSKSWPVTCRTSSSTFKTKQAGIRRLGAATLMSTCCSSSAVSNLHARGERFQL